MTHPMRRAMFFKDLTDQRFYNLVAQWPAGLRGRHSTMWLCLCSCGNLRVIRASDLVEGATRSCGCTRRHDHAHNGKLTPTYNSWRGMISRCLYPKAANYRDYGGRGIQVYPAWRNFKPFLRDMGIRPPGTSIERIDNDGNYEPSNCRWADRQQQSGNQRPKRKGWHKRKKSVSGTK